MHGLKMPHHWIPNSAPEVKEMMLKELGISDIMELFSDIPPHLILKEPPKIGYGKPLTEYEARRKFYEIISKNKVSSDPPPFLGGGVCAHYIPSVVKAIISRSEFYTAYTPYQPEIAQGLLQAFFEYQSMMAELYGVDIVNASLYNGSTAAAEAVRMAIRVKRKRKKVLVSDAVHPETKEVIKTWLMGTGVEVIDVAVNKRSGTTDTEDLTNKLDEEVAVVYLETPNFFGSIETELKSIIELTHEKGALAIVGSNPISLGVLEPPGKLGADIVVGDAQSLGLGLNYGGPSAGILGIKDRKELLRQLPGRLIGATKTVDGKEMGFMMILQTREQHIRRERATSNITTNSGLEAIAAAVYVSLLGADGLASLGKAILGRTLYLIKALQEVKGVEAPAFPEGKYFREVTIRFSNNDVSEVINSLKSEGLLIGPELGRFYGWLSDCSIACVTEVHTKHDIELLVRKLENVLRGE